MFWTDWGSNPKIESAYLNGENRQTIVSTHLTMPSDIVFDYIPKKIYWVDLVTGKIETADYSGGNRKVVLHDNSNRSPFSVVLLNQFLYWTEWRTNSVYQMDKISGSVTNSIKVLSTYFGMGLALFDSSTQPSTSNGCQQNNGCCSFLCLLKPNGYVCVCPYGMVLGNDGKTCIRTVTGCQQPCLFVSNASNIISAPIQANFPHSPTSIISNLKLATALDVHVNRKLIFWSDAKDHSIKKANVDGTNIQVIVKERIGMCNGLAVEWSTDLLYWTDETFNKIEVAHLDGTRRRALISTNLDNPSGIAVDPMSGVVFWTELGSNPKIESAFLNGENRQTIVSSNLGSPSDIVLDYIPKNIYWVDAKTGKIETVNYSGGNRKVLFGDKVILPFSVVLLNQFLFWTESRTNSVYQMDKMLGSVISSITVISPDFRMGLAMFDNSTQPATSNGCQQNNGGCSFLCLLKPNGYVCVCPYGMVLGNDGKTCDGSDPKTGSQTKTIVVGVVVPVLVLIISSVIVLIFCKRLKRSILDRAAGDRQGILHEQSNEDSTTEQELITNNPIYDSTAQNDDAHVYATVDESEEQ